MKFTICDLRFTRRLSVIESGAKATAVQTLSRPSNACGWREAFGRRRVHRRFFADITTT